MKFRNIIFFVFASVLLSACNFTLARDVTPPPGYVAPTPAPTHGPVYPAQAPNLQNGAVIYAEKCAPCHGATGMGDGPQGAQLPVQVPALGSPELASQNSPADWFQIVTLGNMNNFMPPFSSLSDQERWDVVAYAQSLSSAPEQISQGEGLFKENCDACPTDFFTNQEEMSALSQDDLVSLLAEGGEGIPALGEELTQDELKTVAVYLRTLSVDASSLAAESAPDAQAESPSVGETQQPGEAAAETPLASIASGPVSGMLVNGSGGDAPAGATVTLHGFDHTTDPNSTPQEVVTETVETDANGAFTFNNVSSPEGRIFLVEASYKDVAFQSDLVVAKAGMDKITIPDITVYDNTTDSNALVVEQLHVSFDMTTEGSAQVFELFTISNQSDKAYVFSTDGSSLSFMPLPEGAVNVGLELSQDSAPLMATEGGDYAMPPSQDFYSIIAYFDLPYDKSLELSQSLALPISSALIIVPEGIKVKSDQLTDEGIQQTQQGFNVQMFSSAALSAGTQLEMTLSGKAKTTEGTASDSHQTLLIGAGAFGVVLILAGVWMFMRDRDNPDEDDLNDADENEFETTEEVMDAIIALDDLHRAKKIPDEAYQQRREELKARLKELA